MAYSGDQVVQQYQDVSHIVNEKFNSSKENVVQAWNLLIGSVNSLQSLFDAVNIKDYDLTIDPVVVDDTVDDIIGTILNDMKSVAYELMTVPGAILPEPRGEFTDYPAVDTNMLQTLGQEYVAEMMLKLATGGTGLDADVEAAIWTRTLERQELEFLKVYNESLNYFSSRGFELPSGALSGKLNEINIENGRRLDSANMDISVEQAKLAQTNTHFILKEISEFIIKEQQNIFDNITKANSGIIQLYIAELDAYKTVYTTQIAIVEASIKKYTALLEAYKVMATVAGITVDAKVKLAALEIEVAKLNLEKIIKEAELEVEQIKAIYGLKAEAAKALASVAGQMVAASLTSVNASASLGSSGSAGMNVSGSDNRAWDMTKGQASGPEIREIHNFTNK